METKSLLDRVRENIKEAIEGDCDFSDLTNEEIAVEMLAYAENVENENFIDIIEAVRQVRAEGIAVQKVKDA
jgi:hypothetical protein